MSYGYDCYSRNIGGGLIEHMEFGYKSYTIDGEDADYCKECDTLTYEYDLDEYGICEDCRDREGEEDEEDASDTI